MKNQIYIYKEKTNERNYLISIQMLNNTMFNIASFDNPNQFEFYRKTLGFKIKLKQTYNNMSIYESTYKIIDAYFWKITELPNRAKPIKALSNGSIVTCYYFKNYKDNTITIYRPNPNAKEVYKPLNIEEHIQHKNIYGCY